MVVVVMPGKGGGGGVGSSATMASVVIRRPAIDAASCSAVRTTLVGSMIDADSLPLTMLLITG
jgi:hypothetical protein